jgi:hypothetical protein
MFWQPQGLKSQRLSLRRDAGDIYRTAGDDQTHTNFHVALPFVEALLGCMPVLILARFHLFSCRPIDKRTGIPVLYC